MASFTHLAAPNDRASRNDLDARCARIRDRILDGIEETLDELAQPDLQRAARRAVIEGAVWAHCAPLICHRATCRRAKRCRRAPCIVRQAASSLRHGDFSPKLDYPSSWNNGSPGRRA